MPENEKIIKYFRAQVKSVDKEKHTAEVVISDETLDRYKERVMVQSFNGTIKDFMKHPVLLSSHAYRGLLNQIGIFEEVHVDEESKQVVATPKWFAGEGNPEADWGWKLAEKGLAAFSIGFIPKKYKSYDEEERESAGGSCRDYTEIELLEASQVLVPANPAALQKDFDEAKDPFLRDYYEEILKLSAELLKQEEAALSAPAEPESTEEQKAELEIENKKWEETENEIRYRIKEPDDFEKFRYAPLKKDKPRVNAIFGKYKDKDEWAIQALRFPKEDGWNVADAKAWVKAHPDIEKDLSPLVSELDNEISSTASFYQGFAKEVAHLVYEKLKEETIKMSLEHIEGTSASDGAPAGILLTDDEDLEGVLGAEKIAELKETLFGSGVSEDDALRKMFHDMNVEIKEKLSVQP
jgi:hypothetical protein